MTEQKFCIYSRQLPHWRANDARYFVTWRLSKKQTILTPDEKTLISDAIRFFDTKRYELYCFTVMDDHVHVLLSVLKGHRLEQIIHSWKSYSSHQLRSRFGRVGELWQREYYDRIVRDEDELYEKCNYIMTNAVRKSENADNYLWVGVGSGIDGVQ